MANPVRLAGFLDEDDDEAAGAAYSGAGRPSSVLGPVYSGPGTASGEPVAWAWSPSSMSVKYDVTAESMSHLLAVRYSVAWER